MFNVPVILFAWTSGAARPLWPDVEVGQGLGVSGLPFESGHVLALCDRAARRRGFGVESH